MEIQQSLPYRRYLQALGWSVLPIEKTYLVVRHFPFIGTLAKLQRATKLPSVAALTKLIRSHHIRTLSVEPSYTIDQKTFSRWILDVSKFVRINKTPNLSTKTIRVDLTKSEETIFTAFSEAKRRAVRRAQKNNLRIDESTNFGDLIKIKNKSAGFLGSITTYGTDKLWPLFAPDHTAILLAYSSNLSSRPQSRDPSSRRFLNWIPGPSIPAGRQARNDKTIVGGILLLFFDSVAYYWIAGATREGKKLFAPTLLVWEALKLSKKRGAKTFDFIGVWDERIPKENLSWKGFTKFKEGFGGQTLYYPIFPSV